MQKLLIIILLFISANTATAQMKPSMTTSTTKVENSSFPLAGSWILKAAQVLLSDGSLITDTSYGQHAKGLLVIDGHGEYSLQIFRPDRPKFSSGDKKKGTPEEYQAALLGMSTHMGILKWIS